MRLRPLPWLACLAFVCACVAPAVPQDQPAEEVAIGPHHIAFRSVDDLSRYLRHGSDAGPLVSAHRGGPVPGRPENSLGAFEYTLRYGPSILECDIRLTADGVPVLMHDETLNRTTTGRGRLDQEPLAIIRLLRLRDATGARTEYPVPTLAEALAWAEGRAVLTLDIKRGVPPEVVVDAVQRARAQNRVTIIVYNLDDLLAYHRLDPTLNIAGSARSVEDVQAMVESGVDLSRLTVFIGVGRFNEGVVRELHRYGIRAIMGTFGDIDRRAASEGDGVFHELIDRGLDIIATDRPDLAWRAIRSRSAVSVR